MSPNVPPSASVSLRAIALALVIAAAFPPGAADAWGPFDGSYQLTLDTLGVQSIVYLIVLQDGPNIGVAFLALACPQENIPCQSPTWNYGQGLPTGAPNQYTGTTLAANGDQVGGFTLQFSGDIVTGITTTVNFPDSSASGFRLWGGNPAP